MDGFLSSLVNAQLPSRAPSLYSPVLATAPFRCHVVHVPLCWPYAKGPSSDFSPDLPQYVHVPSITPSTNCPEALFAPLGREYNHAPVALPSLNSPTWMAVSL